MKKTPLHAAHLSALAKMGEFAGYDMPLYYPLGVLKEHEWVREEAGIFDVSHMGQIRLEGKGVASFLEYVTPSAFESLKPFAAKYTVLTNEQGGIVDDLIITRLGDNEFFAVINAGCKDKDILWLSQHLPEKVTLSILSQRALLALQGPKAADALRDVLGVDTSGLGYMRMMRVNDLLISRLGYTGEDGFEISVPEDQAEQMWHKLCANPHVKPIGLAARDSLRLEMGYCLYGHDINEITTPLEADLSWVMRKEAVGYLGAAAVKPPERKRVGLVLLDKGVAREGAEIFSKSGAPIGLLSSGGFSPTLKQSIGQGYLPLPFSFEGTKVFIKVRENMIAAKVVQMPFIKPKTKTGKSA
jgi:aminomethyltransferase